MSNIDLIQNLIRLGFRAGPLHVSQYSDLWHLVRAVHNGHAVLTKAGRSTLMKLHQKLKYELGER